ncbi:MAG: branched-chain amino acid transporter permease [Hyphomicrobiales bacterium]|jgi:predicted branched-subunit amino acid permease|nr:branched-chain amino acid transporter permease [Hyphomicrobiales bacterium]
MAAKPVPFTAEGVRAGVRMSLPYVPGYLLFGAAVGTFAAQKGLTFGEAVLMNALVCAAAAQMVALEMWTRDWTWVHVLAVAGVAGMVNMRFVLSGASLRPWLSPVRAGLVYPALGVLTDGAWASSIRYNAEGGRDFGVVIGSSFFLWATWTASSVPGYFIGSLVREPRAFGLDLIIVLTFTATLVPILARTRDFYPFLVSAGAAVVASLALPGYWFIPIGALSGAVAAAFRGERA